MGGVIALKEALALGGRVVWNPPERPRLLVPAGHRDRLLADRETIREVLRRAVIFRAQARTTGPLPILALPDAPLDGPGCMSCGSWAEPDHFRCAVCALAVALALDVEP
ncbi:MAG: hypothetical protein HY575_04550 [candidate division NC10 bacterium]|nr:hypothetical protein [candidate division NC10 bacterium]